MYSNYSLILSSKKRRYDRKARNEYIKILHSLFCVINITRKKQKIIIIPFPLSDLIKIEPFSAYSFHQVDSEH